MKRRRIDARSLCREREKLGWRSLWMTGGGLLLLSVASLRHPAFLGMGGPASEGRNALTAFFLPQTEETQPPLHEKNKLPIPRELPSFLPPEGDFSLPSPLPPYLDVSPMPPMEGAFTSELPPPSPPSSLAELDAFLPPSLAPSHSPDTSGRRAGTSRAAPPSSQSSSPSSPSRLSDASSPVSPPGERVRTRSAAYRHAPRPPYPPSLLERRIEGSVRVRIFIDATGSPTGVSILTSSGYREFDDTARQWILRQWSFFPAEAEGRAVAGSVTTQILFVMD